MYATYTDYVTVYFGNSIEEEEFDKYAERASDYIDYLTMGKAKGYDDANNYLKKACCAIAEQIARQAAVDVGVAEIASESVGSHSVSYRSSAELKAGLDAAMLGAAQMYLLPTGLLYRGVPCIRRIP